MKAPERLFRRIAYIGTPWKVDGPHPASMDGWRSRFLHIGIAFGFMAKGGPYDDRTFYQRTIGSRSVRWHFRYAVTGRSKACA